MSKITSVARYEKPGVSPIKICIFAQNPRRGKFHPMCKFPTYKVLDAPLITEVGVKSPGRQAFCAKISDNALPGRLPRQCAYRIPKLGSSLPILHYKMLLKDFMGLLLQDSLPKVGLGLRLALSRTYDADLRTGSCSENKVRVLLAYVSTSTSVNPLD